MWWFRQYDHIWGPLAWLAYAVAVVLMFWHFGPAGGMIVVALVMAAIFGIETWTDDEEG